jgi:DNA-binding transcriptional MerR regulator
MNEERFSIGELASAAATTPRTIRFYTTEGLLPPPLTEGRNAIYTQSHRRRLRLIQRLKAAYLPLSAIKEQLAGLTDDQVDTLLERSGPHRVENTGPPHPARPQPAAAPQGALAYVSQILAAAEQAIVSAPGVEAAPSPRRVLLVSPLLVDNLDSAAGNDIDAELGIGAQWERILLAGGVELHVRRPVTQARRADVDRLLRYARDLFSGRRE